MRLANRFSTLSVNAACVVGFVLLGGCAKDETSAPPVALDEPANELKWARAALERNPDLKVVDVDKARNSIKVVVKSTGETTNVTPGELAAIPIGDLVALTASAKSTAAAPEPKVTEEPIPVPAAPAAAQPPVPAERAAQDYKVVHEDGKLRISGPGMSVESTATVANANSSNTQPHFDEPIICEGPRMLHLDQRRINVNGNAIIARGGCELHLTNSQISATGVAIVVEDATVHVGNSTIQGGDASFDAGPSAKLYLQNTRFAGTSRRDAQAKINDQGGNIWR